MTIKDTSRPAKRPTAAQRKESEQQSKIRDRLNSEVRQHHELEARVRQVRDQIEQLQQNATGMETERLQRLGACKVLADLLGMTGAELAELGAAPPPPPEPADEGEGESKPA